MLSVQSNMSLSRKVTPGARDSIRRRETSLQTPHSPGRSTSIDASIEYGSHRSPFPSRSTGKFPSSRGQNRISEAAEKQGEWNRQLIQRFIEERFKRKECIYFVKSKKSASKPIAVCECGGILEEHVKFAQGTEQYYQGTSAADNNLGSGQQGEAWSKEKHIEERQPNAFGEINFINEKTGGHKPAKYVRLSDTSNIDDVLEMMTHEKYWDMYRPFEPNLIITVIGGAKNFRLDGKKKEIFNRGLVEAAQSTHAWIITSGSNMGVMKAVGEAVEERQTYQWDSQGYTHTLRCIGIAPWGYVERNKLLLNKNNDWHKTYMASNKILTGLPVSLNPNHTHFLLVDDGIRGYYQGAAEFRAALMSKLAENGKHVLLIVVEGGTDAIIDASKSLARNVPLVLCEGTGRASDILSYAYTFSRIEGSKGAIMISAHHEKELESMLLGAYGETWKQRSKVDVELKKYKKLTMECCQYRHLTSVFNMDKDEALDLAILSALLKGQGASEKDIEILLKQLMLALTWNRCDVAEEQIFNKDINWPDNKLDGAMQKALLEGKANFVRLLLNNGVTMKSYLTVKELRFLYNSDKSKLNYGPLKATSKSALTLRDVYVYLKSLGVKYDQEQYLKDEPGVQNEESFDHPFRELFLWAILTHRHDMAKFLWERTSKCVSSALIATKLYLSLADLVERIDLDLRDSFQQNKEDFEHLASKVVDECHLTHPDYAEELLKRKFPMWNNHDCLQIASEAQDKEFLSSVACQKALDKAWNRGITCAWYKRAFCIFLPFLVFWLVDFEDKSEMSPWQKQMIFFKAPCIKFASNLMLYVIFLLAYSYMILFEFGKSLSVLEIVLLIWILTMIIEEFREMFFLSKDGNLIARLKLWWNFSFFNKIDLAISIVAIVGFLFRINGDWGGYREAKTVYCINCVLFFVRLLSFYQAHSHLGPKLVMIARMIHELMLYIMIMVVFLLAYGVATLAIQNLTQKPYVGVLRDIFYYPYWQIYGELFLEELQGHSDSCNGSSDATLPSGQPCPEGSWLVPALTAFYLLFGNVLLLNLLIAIFTNVFEEVNTNSIQIWKFGMYFLVVEYEVKPSLSPPFVVLEHIFLMGRFIVDCCRGDSKAGVNALPHHTELLDIFEREMQKSYLMRSMTAEMDNVELKINRIHHSVDEVSKLLKTEQLMRNNFLDKAGGTPTGEDAVRRMSRRSTSMVHAVLAHHDSSIRLFDEDTPEGQPTRSDSGLKPIPEVTVESVTPAAASNDDVNKPQVSFKNILDTPEDQYASCNINQLKEAQRNMDPTYGRLGPTAGDKAGVAGDKKRALEGRGKRGPVESEDENTQIRPPLKIDSEDDIKPKKQDEAKKGDKEKKERDKKKKKKSRKQSRRRHSSSEEEEEMEEEEFEEASAQRRRRRGRGGESTDELVVEIPQRTKYQRRRTVDGDDLEDGGVERGIPMRVGGVEQDQSGAERDDKVSNLESRIEETQSQLSNIELMIRNLAYQNPSRVAPLPVQPQETFTPARTHAVSTAAPRMAFQEAAMPEPSSLESESATNITSAPFWQRQFPSSVSGLDYPRFAVPHRTGAPLGGGLHRHPSGTPRTAQRGYRF